MTKFNYRFSLGDTNSGQVGLCFELTLEQMQIDKQEAVATLHQVLEDCNGELLDIRLGLPGIHHACLYLNTKPITADDIVNVTKVETPA